MGRGAEPVEQAGLGQYESTRTQGGDPRAGGRGFPQGVEDLRGGLLATAADGDHRVGALDRVQAVQHHDVGAADGRHRAGPRRADAHVVVRDAVEHHQRDRDVEAQHGRHDD